MAVLDPYAPCPCGSGQKYKWCCQKVEEHVTRAERLIENGQNEMALAALDEGLRRAPDNPWLLTRKAVVLARQDRVDEARAPLERVVRSQPGHVGAQALLIRVILDTESIAAGVGQLQSALSRIKPEDRRGLGSTVQLVGTLLADAGFTPAALKHLHLADRLLGDEEPMIESTLRMLEGNASISAWLRNPYRLAAVPEGLDADRARRFGEAIGWAEEGLWASAAAAFDALSAAGTPESDRNLGLCRLWLADDRGAAEALRRHTAWVGPTPDTVDLEALCQNIAPIPEAERVDHVQLTWPLRDRDALLAALNVDERVASLGRVPVDPDDPEAVEADAFELLDRPAPAPGALPERLDELPRILGRLLVAREVVVLDAYDDGHLDGLSGRVTTLAGPAIPPAHPKTREVGTLPRSSLTLQPDYYVPEQADAKRVADLRRRERNRVILELWPETPMPYLGGRTPRQAAQAGDAKLALRAAVCQYELGTEFFREGVDFAALRASLGVEPEPPVPPDADLETIHIARLHRVPAERLDDDRLQLLMGLAHQFVLPSAMEHAATAAIDRPSLLGRPGMGHVLPYSDMANLALSRGDDDEAFRWAERGRQADPDRAANAVRWDFLELRLRSRSEEPQRWVPVLAALLERHGNDRATSQVVMSNLLDMGLIQLAPNPDNPEQILLDSRRLQAVLSRYGPRITTADGTLGVSASRGGIWTPGSEAPSTGGVWTPGTSAPGEKPRLIIPGQ